MLLLPFIFTNLLFIFENLLLIFEKPCKRLKYTNFVNSLQVCYVGKVLYSNNTIQSFIYLNKVIVTYRVIHRSVDKLKLNYPTYYKGKRNKFLIDRMEI